MYNNVTAGSCDISSTTEIPISSRFHNLNQNQRSSNNNAFLLRMGGGEDDL